ncbi:hypothetical protein [Micromonospora sp. NPDC005203]|uniref:hypothetical protein n=1 Tax=Micromonospora sp. NPDC005203 TaxID=3364226 RepID=UPI003690FD17
MSKVAGRPSKTCRSHPQEAAVIPTVGEVLLARLADAQDMTVTAPPTTAASARAIRFIMCLCGATSLVFAALWLTDTTDPVRMPVLPHWVTALFAADQVGSA